MSNHKPSRILIVDDNPVVRDTFLELLQLEGYEVLAVTDGLGALTAVPQFLPDVILLDVMMPVLDGFSVCRRLKNDRNWQHIPIILVTALDGRDDLLQGLEAGADEFLTKPVELPELRARLRTMLRIKEQYDSLQETLKMREDLVHMAVHDMRSPLTAVMMHAGLMMTDNANLQPDQIKSLEVIREQAQTLNSFANDLLILAKMESGQLALKWQKVFLEEILAPLQEQYTLLARSVNVGFDVHIASLSRPVLIDPSLFTRTIENLLSNALKISNPGGRVTLNVYGLSASTEKGPQLRVEVLDEGPGVPAEYRQTIFDKFKTIEAKKEGVSQTGLGLAFCKMSVEAHNGRIFVTDNQPRGARFVVEL